jgi:sulfoxide reductase heme-binding subunit YedZ
MKDTKFAFQGWSLVAWIAVAIAIMVSLVWLFYGINEQGMRIAIRATARTSCILFLSAFVASSLCRIWSTSLTAWLMKNRRYLGLSFAVSHTYHALAWSGLWFVTSGAAPKFDPGGTLGYAFLIAMTVTSFQPPARWIGQRNWKILHTTGMYFFWLAFTLEFSLRISQSIPIYLPLTTLLVLGMILRLVALKLQRGFLSNPLGNS